MFDEQKAEDFVKLQGALFLITELLNGGYLNALDDDASIIHNQLLIAQNTIQSKQNQLKKELKTWKHSFKEDFQNGKAQCEKYGHIGEWYQDPIFKNWQRLCPRCGMMLISADTPVEVLRYGSKKSEKKE
jgi:hypothetical protein